MPNVLDYLKWRQDLVFEQDPFHHIDSLVLARFVYLPFSLILNENEEITIKTAYQRFRALQNENIRYLIDEDEKLMELVGTSSRFKHCIISHFVDEINKKTSMQFSAMTIHLNHKTHVLVYRGTDNTLVGWKEDLNMCCHTKVEAQKQAVIYARKMMNEYPGKFILCGHSKGGNLALYSSLFLSKKLQKRILWVDNFDGPGLSLELYEKKVNDPMHERIYTFLPQGSVIGRLLYQNNTNLEVVHSTYSGLYQHDLYSWEIMNKEFIQADSFAKNSQVIDASLKEFLEKVSPSDRQKCIEIIFNIISSTNETTFHDLASSWYRHAPAVIKALSEIEAEDRKVIGDMMRVLLDLVMDELKDSFRENRNKNVL